MRISDLICHPRSRRLSHAKLWANVACATATAMFLYQGGRDMLGPEQWLLYLGLVGGYSAALRLIDSRRSRAGGLSAEDDGGRHRHD
ncbi:hypothetical protein KIF53_22100 [Chromobacterium subtsugae]|uniref:Holin n=1 Tax=Chromobacterium subtsugae TaxID=251747 RepID=A0ABS7FJS6_9NEIS|nr:MULTISPECIES: hypothetical protein [Chromobacterium]KUM02922.1 hypothetical protein Cv017_22645 [Chromobacterium subtsugae]KZE84137.1 hypothetical protein AWB61_05405 [Chromobacterium sp. F49]MBW7568661.1 hypothetical protein [Chromobacterium subtsugae]MBW8290333.1 hypothetical protein [Chromobacterium subtsugae]WSE93645.1 hypothetical protein U6115_10525 [Chromobacterium subtsugae]